MWLLLVWVLSNQVAVPQSMLIMMDRESCMTVKEMVSNRDIIVPSNVIGVSCAQSSEPTPVR